MSFKVRSLLAIVTMALACQCGLQTGEKSPAEKAPQYSGRGFSCVGKIPESIESYFADEMDETQITTFIQCLQNAFVAFVQKTRGRDENTYSPVEIRDFLRTYFLREREISDQLLYEFMVIKQAMVGGGLQRISRAELHATVEILEDLRKEAIRIRPYLKFLNPRLIDKQDPENIGRKLDEAYEALKISIEVMTARLQKSRRHYQLANFENLIVEFRKFVRWDDYFKDAKDAKDWIQLIRTFKQVTVTSLEPNAIRPADWVPLLKSASRWYLAYLQFKVGVQSQPILYGMGLQNTMHLAQFLFELLEEAVHRQPTKVVGFEQMAAVVSTFQRLGWMPSYIRAQSLEQALRALFGRMFGDERKPSDGLTLTAVALIKYEFYRWAYIQLNLDTMRSSEQGGKSWQHVPNIQSNLYITPGLQARLREIQGSDWNEFIQIKDLMRPLFPKGSHKAFMVYESDLSLYSLSHDFHNLSAMNLIRTLVGLVFRGYVQEPARRTGWKAQIKSEELQAFYLDFRDIAIDLGLADPQNMNVGSRAFVEGNLFTYSSDGYAPENNGNHLNFLEAMELMAFLYTGGAMAHPFYTTLAKICNHGPKDVNGEPSLSRSCVIEALPKLMDDYGQNMPDLWAYLRRSTPAERTKYLGDILGTTLAGRKDQSWVERRDFSTFLVIVHYSEAVLTRFDLDKNGVINSNEARQAAPIFSGFIRKVAKDRDGTNLPDAVARGVFLYILLEKELPESGFSWSFVRSLGHSVDLSGELNFLIGKYRIDWNSTLNLDRKELSQVFRVITKELIALGQNAKPRGPRPKVCLQNCSGQN